MTKKRAIAAGFAVLLGIVVLWWVTRDDGDPRSDSDEQALGAGPERELNPRLRKRVDVMSLAKASLSGRVVDADGKGMAGARVCGSASGDDLDHQTLRVPTCTVSKDGGHYALTQLVPADWSVNASLAGYVPGRYWKEDEDGDPETQVELEADEHATDIDIELGPGGVEVRGIVKDIGGGPVAGAWVKVDGRGRRVGESVITTNEAGEFSAWTSKGRMRVHATAEGYADGSARGIAPGQFIEVLLTPESVLAGQVIDAKTRKPVARARVGSSASRWSPLGGGRGETLTDERGEFRIVGLEAGRYKPHAEIAGAYGKARESVLLGLGQTVEGVVIELHPAFVVTGTIVVADDGDKPCKDGGVNLVNAETERRFSGYTEEHDGRVEIEAVLPGTYKVSVTCTDRLASDEYPEIIVVGDVLDQHWEVTTGGVIRGKVIDEAGKPIAEATISGELAGGSFSMRSRLWDRVEEDGRFELEGVGPGTWRLEARADGVPSNEEPTEVELEAGGSANVEITLATGGFIRGSVVDEHDKPVKGANVRASGAKWGGGWRTRTQTLDDGSFEIEGVRAGEYRVTASGGGGFWGGGRMRRPGSGDDDQQGEKVVVRAGEASSVKLVVESRTGAIRGKVLDEAGKPVTDAFVDAERQSERAGAFAGRARRSVRWRWRRTPALTDMDGSFEVKELGPGTYAVRAYRRGGGEAIAEGVEIGGDVTLTIPAVGSMAGKVSVPSSDPPTEFSISIIDRLSGFNRSEHFYRTRGDWVMRDLPSGTFTVSVESGLGTAKKENVALGDGQVMTSVVLELEARATVTGRVVALDSGEPIAGHQIHVRALKGSAGTPWMWGVEDKKSTTDDSGRFEIGGAPAGRVWVRAWPTDWEESEFTSARKLATLEAGKTTDVGDLKAVRKRTEARERSGDLGFTLKESPPDTEPEDQVLEVALIRPDGPAAATDLEVGDVIVSVEGNDVRGVNSHFYHSLSDVAEGDKVMLGLARDETVAITAGKPRR